MYKIGNKIIAVILVTTILWANLSILALQSYAAELEIGKQDTKTNHENIEFNAYFQEGSHEINANIQEQIKMYINIKVKQAGYLKNAKIEILDPNFSLAFTSLQNENIQKIEENTIFLNQLNYNTDITIEIPVQILNQDIIKEDFLKRITKIKLTGEYIDEQGKEKQIEKEIVNKINWEATPEVELSQEISRYIPYNVNGSCGIILQTKITTKLKDDILPINKTEIEVDIPEIMGQTPDKIIVTANQTAATNGKTDGLEFNEQDWEYNEQEKKITIKTENPSNENGEIVWKKQGLDEYIVTFVYTQKDSYDKINGVQVQIDLKSKAKIQAYGTENQVEKEEAKQVELNEKIGDIVNFEINTKQNKIDKGYLYANYDKQTGKTETIYTINYIANIGYKDLIDGIVIQQNDETMQTEENLKYSVANSSYDKEIKIKEQIFKNILGEEGFVEIVGKQGETLAKIDNKTEIKDGNYYYDCTTLGQETYAIRTSKPIHEGKLEIEKTKAIKGEIGYTKEELQNFKLLENEIIGTAYYNNQELVKGTTKVNIPLQETITTAEIEISTPNLSTVVKNENVQITVLLKTDSTEMALYKNPTIEIQLPEHIKEIEVKDVKALFSDEIQITNATLEEENTHKKIYLQLSGTQTNYNIETISKGLTIQILADITLDKLTPTKESEIKLYYTNENQGNYAVENNGKGYTTAQVKFIAPTGLSTIQSISNYAVGEKTVLSMNGEEQIGKIEKQSEEVNADVNITIMNNYNNPVNNIRVLGRIPFKGNKTITNGQDLGTTFDCLLQTPIESQEINKEQVIIYYSENGEATEDLNNANNGWKTENIDFSKIKSYLIVLPNHIMNTGDILNFKYTIQIPQQLQKNESAFSTYIVYFDNQQSERMIQDRSMATKVGVTTGTGPILEATMSSSIPADQTVKEGQIITYKVTVKNTGNIEGKKIIVTAPIPEGTKYVEYTSGDAYSDPTFVENATKKTMSWDIEKLSPGESFTAEFQVKIGTIKEEYFCKDETHYFINENNTKQHDPDKKHDDSEYKSSIVSKVTVYQGDEFETTESNEVINNTQRGYISLQIVAKPDDKNIKENTKITYKGKIENTTNQEQTEVTASIAVPQGLTYQNASINGENDNVYYDEAERKVYYSVQKLEAEEIVPVTLEVITNEILGENYTKEINLKMEASSNKLDLVTSNEIIQNVIKPNLTVKQTSSIQENTVISVGDEMSIYITVKNEGNTEVKNVKIQDYIPEGLRYISSNYKIDNGEAAQEYNYVNSVSQLIIDIPAGSTVVLTIKVKVDAFEGEQKQVINKVKISGDGIEPKEANTLTYIIEGTGANTENGDNGNSAGKGNYRISGTAWLDENGNGEKEESEKRLSNIEVALVDSQTGEFITNEVGERITSKTSNSGTYSFIKLAEGNYTVVFFYDSAQYSLTQYHKDGITEDYNSDAIASTLEIEGEQKQVGVTENLTISNSNLYNIDVGLTISPKFDLKLEKYVSKITVQNKTGTKTYEYNDTKLAKRELIASQLNNTNLVIEYKIKVTNEGAISGFAKKIVDYFPKELKFNSELNPDWYTDNAGNVYNSSLANERINPGETKEITLIATKKMTEENTGNINNTAEIYESYNEFGIADVDSTPGNKAQGEDDMSSADIILSIRTGKTVTYFALTISIIAIIGTGAYFIKRKVLRV